MSPKEIAERPLPGNMDALVWAKEFVRLYFEKTTPSEPWVDEGLMLGWFANAIMTGFDEATLRVEKKVEALERELSAYKKAKAENDERFQNEIAELSSCESLLSTPVQDSVINEMKRRMISWGFHVSDRDQFKEMELERENESLRREIEALRSGSVSAYRFISHSLTDTAKKDLGISIEKANKIRAERGEGK